ncbi:unnamed protein product [Adineta steineri]|uniref:Uncharacterized protein n=1 Tax=Adineta steineri TaxID=433720 RepID=A0A819E5U7_9BILA|nr:unnamed protein product [Adineta steineri]CAF3844762.1 unnamed protein product [Adineta steineri]
MKHQSLIHLFFLLFIQNSQCSFWNDIPSRCTYDKTTLLSCWNTTFTKSIPLLNDLKYTLENSHVEIRDSNFQLSLNDLFINVASNIEYLILINNTFSSKLFNENKKIYFRLLQSLEIQDEKGLQWFQLNTSYYPQLTSLDLSYNQFTNKKQFLFEQKYFPQLKSLHLSHNQLESIDNLNGNILNRIEYLILSFNPLQTILNKIHEFQSLIFLDVSSTLIKQLFHLELLPRLETFRCRHCQQIPMNEYEKFLNNCSQINNRLILDFTETNITSVKIFNSCIKDLTLKNQSLTNSISTDDFLSTTNLENIQIRNIDTINYIHFNIYDRLKRIDFSDNKNLKQVRLRLMSDYTYLKQIIISNTAVNDFSIDFNDTIQKFVHVDVIDLSYNYLETLDFLHYLTFFTLDVSFNRLKIIDINQIHFQHGMYELSSMNLLNLSYNQMESIKINWNNESPHIIDLSQNNLQSIKLRGQSTYKLLLSNNTKLSLIPSTFYAELPSLKYLDLDSIQLNSFEHLIYLHNLSNIHTLILNNNQLNKQHRTLNWNIFYPWRKYLTHVSLQNMSIEKLDSTNHLNDYYHLLTVDLSSNNDLKCNCELHHFIDWLKIPPSTLAVFNEPRNKGLKLDCLVSFFSLQCKDNQSKSTKLFIGIVIIGIVFLIITLMIATVIIYYIRRKQQSKSYHSVFGDTDLMALNETDTLQKIDDDD